MTDCKIEYRQLYARMYTMHVRNGKFYIDRSADALQAGRHDDALADLRIARSFFPDNAKLRQLIKLVKAKKAKAKVAQSASRLPAPHKGSS
jgi:hypothetical protein